MQMQATQSGANVVVLPNYGGHTWENWGRGLRDGREEVTEALRGTPPVTAKTQVVNASGTPVPEGATKVTEAALMAADTPSALPTDIPDSSGSPTTSAVPSGSETLPADSSPAAEPVAPAATETPAAEATDPTDESPVAEVPATSTPSAAATSTVTSPPSSTPAAP
jgi:hypothetical protein